MAERDDATLPYRGDWEGLVGFVEGFARRREVAKVQAALGLSNKSMQGLALAAQRLGLTEDASEGLSASGQRFALTRSPEERKDIVLAGIVRYEPYGLLLENVFRGDEATTPLQHFETWWSTSGYGASENNRAEAASAFANLLDGTGAATFIRGRRGKVSRVEWNTSVKDRLREALATGELRSSSDNAPLADEQAQTPPPTTEKAPSEEKKQHFTGPSTKPPPSSNAVETEDPIRFRLSNQCTAHVYLLGTPTLEAIERLIKYLEVSKETYPSEIP